MISLLFSYLVYVSVAVLVVSTGYPNQKYVLFKKLPDGRIRKVETFTEPISREQAISMYGSDHYMLQSMKPRTRTIWNDLSAYSKEGSEKNGAHVIELQRIERKTDNLGLGLAGVAIGTAVAHGVAAWNFVAHGERLNRIEAILAATPLTSLQTQYVCQSCHQPPFSLLDQYCRHCGVKITWADGSRLPLPNLERICPRCLAPVQANQAYCTECGVPFLNPSTDSSQAPRWRLP